MNASYDSAGTSKPPTSRIYSPANDRPRIRLPPGKAFTDRRGAVIWEFMVRRHVMYGTTRSDCAASGRRSLPCATVAQSRPTRHRTPEVGWPLLLRGSRSLGGRKAGEEGPYVGDALFDGDLHSDVPDRGHRHCVRVWHRFGDGLRFAIRILKLADDH